MQNEYHAIGGGGTEEAHSLTILGQRAGKSPASPQNPPSPQSAPQGRKFRFCLEPKFAQLSKRARHFRIGLKHAYDAPGLTVAADLADEVVRKPAH
jgi:hypothetical protein